MTRFNLLQNATEKDISYKAQLMHMKTTANIKVQNKFLKKLYIYI